MEKPIQYCKVKKQKTKNIALTRRTFAGKVMSLLFNMLSRLLITFLPKSKYLLISWLTIWLWIHKFSKQTIFSSVFPQKNEKLSIHSLLRTCQVFTGKNKLVLSVGAVCLWFTCRRVNFFSFFHIDIHCKIHISEGFSKVVAHSK